MVLNVRGATLECLESSKLPRGVPYSHRRDFRPWLRTIADQTVRNVRVSAGGKSQAFWFPVPPRFIRPP